MRVALVIVSDTVYLDPSRDQLAPAVRKSCEELRWILSHVTFVPNDILEVRRAVLNLARDHDLVLVCGGTGPGTWDVTIEAVKPLLEKELPGFGEYLRARSLQEVGVRALLSRSIAGLVGTALVTCVPGSPSAVELVLREVLPELLPHVRELVTGLKEWELGQYLLVPRDRLSPRELELLYRVTYSAASRYGCAATFSGFVKRYSRGRLVREFRVELDLRELEKQVQSLVRERKCFVVLGISTGTLRPGDPITYIGVVAETRDVAFGTARELLEFLKSRCRHVEVLEEQT